MEFPMTKRYVNGNTCIHNKQAIFYHNVSEGKAQVAHRILKTHFFPPNNWDGKIGNPYVGLEKNVVSLYTYFIFPLSCGHKYSHVFLVFFPGITGHRLPIPQISTDRYQIDVCSTFWMIHDSRMLHVSSLQYGPWHWQVSENQRHHGREMQGAHPFRPVGSNKGNGARKEFRTANSPKWCCAILCPFLFVTFIEACTIQPCCYESHKQYDMLCASAWCL